jgi:hypothetical protein
MNEQVIGLAAVLMLFGLMPLVAGLVFLKIKSRKMEAMVKLVELGTTLDAEMLRVLSDGAANYKTDYRWALIWLAIGIPVTLGLWVQVGAEEAIWGLIPVFIGLAFAIAGKLRLRESP